MNNISENTISGKNFEVGDGVTIRSGCIIEDNVKIGDNVFIDYGVIIHSNVSIGNSATIGARCILGEYISDFYDNRINLYHPLIIGDNALIRSDTIIYGDNVIGKHFQTGHRVTIRENTKLGNHVRIGTLSDIQGDCEIQDYVNIHSNVHIGMKSFIEKYVMIFPYVVLTNDPYPPSRPLHGVYIEQFSIISTGAVLLPGVRIGEDALVGAGAIVTKDVNKLTIAVGNPAKMIGNTSKIINRDNGKQVYPWRYSFEEGMPWEGIGYEKWYAREESSGAIDTD